jgi:hypothetical protein
VRRHTGDPAAGRGRVGLTQPISHARIIAVRISHATVVFVMDTISLPLKLAWHRFEREFCSHIPFDVIHCVNLHTNSACITSCVSIHESMCLSQSMNMTEAWLNHQIPIFPWMIGSCEPETPDLRESSHCRSLHLQIGASEPIAVRPSIARTQAVRSLSLPLHIGRQNQTLEFTPDFYFQPESFGTSRGRRIDEISPKSYVSRGRRLNSTASKAWPIGLALS